MQSGHIHSTFHHLSADIMACQISSGQFCHINSPQYTADTSTSYSYTLFLNDKARINCVCILSVINQTHDEAININGIISTFQDNKKIVHHMLTI